MWSNEDTDELRSGGEKEWEDDNREAARVHIDLQASNLVLILEEGSRMFDSPGSKEAFCPQATSGHMCAILGWSGNAWSLQGPHVALVYLE